MMVIMVMMRTMVMMIMPFRASPWLAMVSDRSLPHKPMFRPVRPIQEEDAGDDEDC